MTLQELTNYLNENDLYYTDVYETYNTFVIFIDWGDWKHEHLYLNHLMDKLGLIYKNCVITDENDSDCYSAEYEYYKPNKLT